MDCAPIYPTSYHKQNVGPYTKMHIIMTNGIVVETMFKHQSHAIVKTMIYAEN